MSVSPSRSSSRATSRSQRADSKPREADPQPAEESRPAAPVVDAPAVTPAAEGVRLVVRDLAYAATERDVREFFADNADDLTQVWIARNPPGFCFVRYVGKAPVDDFIAKYHGRALLGRNIKIEVSNRQEGGKRERGPGHTNDRPAFRGPRPEFERRPFGGDRRTDDRRFEERRPYEERRPPHDSQGHRPLHHHDDQRRGYDDRRPPRDDRDRRPYDDRDRRPYDDRRRDDRADNRGFRRFDDRDRRPYDDRRPPHDDRRPPRDDRDRRGDNDRRPPADHRDAPVLGA